MTTETLLSMLMRPKKPVDVVLDTDAYNEIDDQYAIGYLLSLGNKVNIKAIYAAPFFNHKVATAQEGMEKSYQEVCKVLDLAGHTGLAQHVLMGSDSFLKDERKPVSSPAAIDLAQRAMAYSSKNPLYVIGIGAITNIASALLINPGIIDRIVVLWLGGHGWHWPNTREFNMLQDVGAARVVFGSGAPLVQFPCNGVADVFRVSKPELMAWLKGRNKLCDYLATNTIREAEAYAGDAAWSRVIWDVLPIAWLADTEGAMVLDRLAYTPIPQYDDHYSFKQDGQIMRYVYQVKRDQLLNHMIASLRSLA